MVSGEPYKGGCVGARARAESEATTSSFSTQQQRDTTKKSETKSGDSLTKLKCDLSSNHLEIVTLINYLFIHTRFCY